MLLSFFLLGRGVCVCVFVFFVGGKYLNVDLLRWGWSFFTLLISTQPHRLGEELKQPNYVIFPSPFTLTSTISTLAAAACLDCERNIFRKLFKLHLLRNILWLLFFVLNQMSFRFYFLLSHDKWSNILLALLIMMGIDWNKFQFLLLLLLLCFFLSFFVNTEKKLQLVEIAQAKFDFIFKQKILLTDNQFCSVLLIKHLKTCNRLIFCFINSIISSEIISCLSISHRSIKNFTTNILYKSVSFTNLLPARTDKSISPVTTWIWFENFIELFKNNLVRKLIS